LPIGWRNVKPRPKQNPIRVPIVKAKKKDDKKTLVPLPALPRFEPKTEEMRKAELKKAGLTIESHLSFPGMGLLMEDSPATSMSPPATPKEEAPPKVKSASKKKKTSKSKTE
jgi:hypothetical protein